jgi:hypothetical protein
MTLNYWVMVERYSFSNEVVDDPIYVIKSSFYLMKKPR